MLFDLRGAGRRRTVKFVYLSLAVLMFVGFVGFSIGSSGLSGGLLDVFTQGGGGSSGSTTNRFQRQVERARTATRTHPSDPAAWAALAQAHVRMAGVGDNFDAQANNYTAGGRRELQAAANAWSKYLDLDPKHPDERLARQMVPAFVALNQPAGAATAQEIVAAASPTSQTFANLAFYAYHAGQPHKGDLAAQKAVALAPKSERKALKSQLAQYKTQAAASPTPTPGR